MNRVARVGVDRELDSAGARAFGDIPGTNEDLWIGGIGDRERDVLVVAVIANAIADEANFGGGMLVVRVLAGR